MTATDECELEAAGSAKVELPFFRICSPKAAGFLADLLTRYMLKALSSLGIARPDWNSDIVSATDCVTLPSIAAGRKTGIITIIYQPVMLAQRRTAGGAFIC